MRSQEPNIILINCDDLGYGDVECYGSTCNSTPNLDRLAAEGMRFTDFYAASPVCSPSRGAMMTACYPPRIGFDLFRGRTNKVLFPGDAEGLHANEKTLPQLLKEAGYGTCMVGKWHCGDQPEFLPRQRGFDRYFGLPYSNDMGRQEPKLHHPPLPLIEDDAIIQEQPDQRGLTERYTEACVRFMRQSVGKPFFLYLAHMYVHVPLFVPPRFMRSSRNGAYGGAVEHIDWTMGVILDELERLGIDQNTIIIFTSDNGSRAKGEGGSNAPLRGTKGQTWEGGQRVPFIVRWPEKVAAGRTCPHLCTGMDVLPTLVRLAGGTVPDDRTLDGEDFSAVFLDPEAPAPRQSFAYYFGDALEAVRKGPWKLHFPSEKKGVTSPELYHLEEDPGETRNVAEANPGVVRDLASLADTFRDELGDGLTGAKGQGRRPVGMAADPSPLTTYDPDHPYMIAMYDLNDCDGTVMAG